MKVVGRSVNACSLKELVLDLIKGFRLDRFTGLTLDG